jgi:cold shock CspA family protein
MQMKGTLSKWNNDTGSGFITPKRGGQDIRVDISAFPEDGQRPQLHEKLSFNVTTDSNGEKMATQIVRMSRKINAPQQSVSPRKRINTTPLIASLALFVAVLAYGYIGLYTDTDKSTEKAASRNATQGAPSFTCDGRTLCSQMTSCEEAQFFLHNCPAVQLDGNGDGIPCEQQWCGRE